MQFTNLIIKGENMSQQTLNLQTLVDIDSTDNTQLKEAALRLYDWGYDPKSQKGMEYCEFSDFSKLIRKILNNNLLEESQLQGYIMGYSTNGGLREQFDVLRFSSNTVLNIELKSSPPKKGLESIRRQLKKHSLYLSVLKDHYENFIFCTYVTSTNTLYKLDDDKLNEIPIEELSRLIPKDFDAEKPVPSINLNQLIVSPYIKPNKFKNHEYFLTDEQYKKRNEILNSKERICELNGAAGTGKTLVLLDLAKEYIERNQSVLLVFCGVMKQAKAVGDDLNINLRTISRIDFQSDIQELNRYDIILFDESQRLYESQFKSILELNHPKIIFSTDQEQTLHPTEANLNISEKIQKLSDEKTVSLKKKIRNDPAMSSFIQKFLNSSKSKITPYEYPKVHLVYFSSKNDAENFIIEKCRDGFTSIEPTEFNSRYSYVSFRKKICSSSISVHEAIGREYNKVLIPLDEYYDIDDNGSIIGSYSKSFGYPYKEISLLFESLTRVKEDLLLVIVNNPKLFIHAQRVLNWKQDKEGEKLRKESAEEKIKQKSRIS